LSVYPFGIFGNVKLPQVARFDPNRVTYRINIQTGINFAICKSILLSVYIIMSKITHRYKGFSLVEISIVLTVLLVFSGIVLWNLSSIASKNKAKECSRNLLMLNQAVNNYCLDNNISYGTGVQMSNLISGGYLNAQESYDCPYNKTPYQTTFTYGTIPVCPDSISDHACSTD